MSKLGNLKLKAKIINTILPVYTVRDIERSFWDGIRLVHIILWNAQREIIANVMLNVQTAIGNFYLKNPCYHIPISIIFEIRGRVTRLGRLRNNKRINLKSREMIVLTSLPDYEFCGVKEIIYVYNFKNYIPKLKVGDLIFINGKSIQLIVVKILGGHVSCCILNNCRCESYLEVILPFYIKETDQATAEEIDDISFAITNGADFILAPLVTTVDYHTALHSVVQDRCKLIACIDICLQKDMACVREIIKLFDGIWINSLQNLNDARILIDCARCHEKFNIVKWPNDKKFINDLYLNQNVDGFALVDIDCFVVNNKMNLRKAIKMFKFMAESHYENMAIYFANQIDKANNIFAKCSALAADVMNSKAIITISATGQSAIQLSCQRPNCVVIAVVPNETIGRFLNVYRSIIPLVCERKRKCKTDWKTEVEDRMKFAVDFGRTTKLLNIGDLVVFCYEIRNSCLKYPDSFRISYIGRDKIIFKTCKTAQIDGSVPVAPCEK